MDSDDDDMGLEDEIAEILAFETAALAAMRAGDPELAVLNPDGTLRCPLCSPSKKKQSYAYQDLLQHATAVAVGIRGPEAAGKHSALKLYLESDLASLAPQPVERAREVGDHEVRPRRREAEKKLVWPWSVVIYQSTSGGDPDGQIYFGKNEIKTHFAEFKPEKVHIVRVAGHLGFSILQFGRGFEGLNDALALDQYFMGEEHSRRDYQRNAASESLGEGYYGWLAREEDFSGRHGAEAAAVANQLKTYGDLRDIGMVADEIKKIHDLQVKKLAESLEEKAKESMNLKTELEVLQRRAEVERLQLEESLKHERPEPKMSPIAVRARISCTDCSISKAGCWTVIGTWQSCHIL